MRLKLHFGNASEMNVVGRRELQNVDNAFPPFVNHPQQHKPTGMKLITTIVNGKQKVFLIKGPLSEPGQRLDPSNASSAFTVVPTYSKDVFEFRDD